MDITKFIIEGRDQALLYGDYSTYHHQLSKRTANSRKKLGLATKNRGKFQKKDHVTAEQIGENREYVLSFSLLGFFLPALDMSTSTSSRANAPGLTP